jgi:hypothetical protein
VIASGPPCAVVIDALVPGTTAYADGLTACVQGDWFTARRPWPLAIWAECIVSVRSRISGATFKVAVRHSISTVCWPAATFGTTKANERTSSRPWPGAMKSGVTPVGCPSTRARTYAPAVPNISAVTAIVRLLAPADWIAPERPGTARQSASGPLTGASPN